MHPDLHHLLHVQREAEIVREAELRRLVAERAAEDDIVRPRRRRPRRGAWRDGSRRGVSVPHRAAPSS